VSRSCAISLPTPAISDENLDFVQHAVCDYGKLVERMIEPRDRDTFAQVPDMMRRTRAFKSVTRR